MAWGGHRSQLIISGYSLSLSFLLALTSHTHLMAPMVLRPGIPGMVFCQNCTIPAVGIGMGYTTTHS